MRAAWSAGKKAAVSPVVAPIIAHHAVEPSSYASTSSAVRRAAIATSPPP